MTINGQSAAGATVPDTKLARDATELMREAASNLISLHSRPLSRWGSPPGHGVPEDSIRRMWTAFALPTAPGIPEFTEPEVALVTAGVEPPGHEALVLRVHLPRAAALLLEMVADDAHGDSDAAAPALERDLELTGPDSSLPAALICVALGLLYRQARHCPADTALAWEAEGLPGEASEPAPPPGEPAWRGEPLTQSETRVLRYLPTHMGTPEIAAELYISANTVRTHQRHLYRKLGAHSRHEAVQHARALGLLPASSAGHRTPAAVRPHAGATPPV
jgi:DNA-binding CsgD family transcriptional regulator